MKLRLHAIDTPEVTGIEKIDGEKVKYVLKEMVLDKDKQGKYGRCLATIVLKDGLNVNQWLVDNGHAKTYMV